MNQVLGLQWQQQYTDSKAEMKKLIWFTRLFDVARRYVAENLAHRTSKLAGVDEVRTRLP